MNQRTLQSCIFYCSNHLQAEQLARLECAGTSGHTVKAISLPCSGKVDIPYLVKAFETGADGIVIVRCPPGQCRRAEGTLRAHKRAQAVEALLQEIGFSPGRVAVLECAEGGASQVLADIKEFAERLRTLPAMPAIAS